MLLKSMLVIVLTLCTLQWDTLPAIAQSESAGEVTESPGEVERTPESRGRLGQGRAERRGGLRGRWRGGNRQLLGLVPLLQIESVQQELAGTEDETTKIDTLTVQIREDFSEEVRELMESMRESDPQERQNLRTRIADVRERVNARLAASLSGEQFQRLNQIDLQLGLRRNGALALTSEEIAEALDLTSEQQVQLRAKAREARQQADADGPPTLESAREQVSGILTAAQLEKLDTLLGVEFDLPAAMLESPPRGQRGVRRQGGRQEQPLRDPDDREVAPEAPAI